MKLNKFIYKYAIDKLYYILYIIIYIINVISAFIFNCSYLTIINKKSKIIVKIIIVIQSPLFFNSVVK